MAHHSKTDNGNLAAKLKLRRYFLQKYHVGERPAVLDCCQGQGKIWSALRQEFDIDYWGVDVKPLKGRLKLDSVKILSQRGWPQTVIDVDTYGSPWRHWEAMLPNVVRPIAVFLTVGALMYRRATDRYALAAMNIQFARLRLPETLCGRLSDFSLQYCLAECYRWELDMPELVEMPRSGNARYIGLRLVPRNYVQPDIEASSLSHES
jgi:hypothetical protein